MSQVPNINTSSAGDQAFGSNNALNELDMDDFLNLMIAELQNQDPLNPLENDELIAQISQIREVGATEDLTSTLNAVLLGQNISSATNLIGADVVALNDAGERVSGNVRVVTITDGQPSLDLAIESAATRRHWRRRHRRRQLRVRSRLGERQWHVVRYGNFREYVESDQFPRWHSAQQSPRNSHRQTDLPH